MAPDPVKPPRKPSTAKTGYLILYNAISAILWAAVLGRTIGANVLKGPPFVFLATGEFVKWTQTLMIMDVVHALLGVVRSDPLTAGAQVASRLVLIWAVQNPFPHLCQSPIYSTMLFAWSLTEVIRYSFLAVKLCGSEPYPFLWVRYSAYRILYPMGILSEWYMMYSALAGPASRLGNVFFYVLALCFGVIWPYGAFFLIGHMERQRKKVLRAAKGKDVKATQ